MKRPYLIVIGIVLLGVSLLPTQETWAQSPSAKPSPPPPPTLTPTISPPGGTYYSPTKVTISARKHDASNRICITYTIASKNDDNQPTTTSETKCSTGRGRVFSVSFTLDRSAKVTASAVEDGHPPSRTVEATYKICNPCFFIVVMGAYNGIPIEAVAAQAQVMVQTIEPWSEYQDQIVIVPVRNTVDLDCRTVLTPNGKFPLCPNEGAVARALGNMIWNAAIIATDINCECGTVASIGNRITAVGQQASASLLAHELAHAVANMVDEYYYKFQSRGRPTGPNCFDSESSCLAKKSEFPDMECSLGCVTTSTWRPYSLLMHNEIGSPYGKFDACIVAGKIAAILRKTVKCKTGDHTPGPSASPQVSPGYWGWTR